MLGLRRRDSTGLLFGRSGRHCWQKLPGDANHERFDVAAVSPPPGSGSVDRRLLARPLPEHLALRPRCRTTGRRRLRARALECQAMEGVARGTDGLRPPPRRHSDPVLSRAVDCPSAPRRPRLLGRPIELARSGERAAASPPGCLRCRRLRPPPHVPRAHQRNQRQVPQSLVHPPDRPALVRLVRSSLAALVWSVPERPLGDSRRAAGNARATQATPVLGLERTDEAALHVVVPPGPRPYPPLPRRPGPLPGHLPAGLYFVPFRS